MTMPLLRAEGLMKSFGGFRAVDGVELQVAAGTVHAVIGPNGAGKTTLFNLLAGYTRPTAGHVRFESRDITGLAPDAICRRGIVCTFQITEIFPRLTVTESVECAVLARLRQQWRLWAGLGGRARDEAWELLEVVGLAGVADQRSGALSHGDKRVLEVALALATQPRLLLLDEPTAGMSPVETERTVGLVRRLARERNLTVLLVEHDVKVVFSVSDRITVMHQGRVLKEGEPDEVRRSAEVIDVYLGAPV
jgi:branched-chain amino acid transport system ATP-binding protein